MQTTGHTHDTFTSVRPSRSCSQARDANAELAAITESDWASWGLAMVAYAVLSLSLHAAHPKTMTLPLRTTDAHKQA
jgi:hypothetical protein